MTASSRRLLGVLGGLMVAVIWEVIGRTGVFGDTFPPLTHVVGYLVAGDHRVVLEHAAAATLTSAGLGYLLGVAVALAGAALTEAVPKARSGVDRLAAVLNAVPVIALGPLFISTVGRSRTPIAVAMLAVAFTMFVAATSGLRRSRPANEDVLSVLGVSRRSRLVHLRAPAALPQVASGLRLCAPAAILGAIIGEWFGAPKGLGLIIVSAMGNFQIDLLWAAALLAALVSLVAFGLLGILDRFVSRRFADA